LQFTSDGKLTHISPEPTNPPTNNSEKFDIEYKNNDIDPMNNIVVKTKNKELIFL
jgi:hypothetical protein